MTANTAGMCASFKAEILQGVHAIGPGGAGSIIPARATEVADVVKGALYFANESIGPATTAYTAAGEITNTAGAGYTAGGQALTFGTAPAVGANGTSAIVTPTANLVWNTLTVTSASFDTLLLYNSTQGGRAISAHNFGAQTITAGTLTLTMPVNAVGTALLEID